MSNPLTVGGTGNAAYNAKVAEIRKRLADSIPESLRLPASLLENLPSDVTEIPVTCGLLTAKDIEITDLDASGVVEAVASKKISAVDAVTAFGKRAAIAQQLVGCLTEFFMDEGIAQAKELDAYYEKTGKVVGPLHGLPIGVKDHMVVKGHWASSGWLGDNKVYDHDAPLVALLRKLGCVFYVKTNQPQGIMHLETHSFYSRTLNPYNIKLSPGGSSGGQSALEVLKGSCIGLGTDIGGSIRNPSACCGIYGMRPTTRSMPMRDFLWYQGGSDSIVCSVGPMCRSARDVNLFFKSVWDCKPYLFDPMLSPVVYNGPYIPEGRPLKIGILKHDDVVMPQPPILRGLELAIKKLTGVPGVELVEYKPYKHDVGYDIIRELYFPDDADAQKKLMAEAGEDMLPLTEFVIQPSHTKPHDAAGMFELLERRDTYRQEYSDHWNASGIDVLLCPPHSGVANPHDTARYWGYTAQWNLVDYPGFVFPTGLKCDPAIDKKPTEFTPMSAFDKDNYEIFNPELQANAPISLQIVSRRWNDALVIGAQALIEKAIKA